MNTESVILLLSVSLIIWDLVIVIILYKLYSNMKLNFDYQTYQHNTLLQASKDIAQLSINNQQIIKSTREQVNNLRSK